MKNKSKQTHSNAIINNLEYSEDEPLPLNYITKLKPIASLKNETSGTNPKKIFGVKNIKAEEAKGNKIIDKEDEIKIPISNQKQEINNLEDKNNYCDNGNISGNKYAGYNSTSSNLSNKINENLNLRNVDGLKNDCTNISGCIAKEDNLFGDEEEDKPMILNNEIKKCSLNSQTKNTSANVKQPSSIESNNQKKNPKCHFNNGDVRENNFNSNLVASKQNNKNGKVYMKLGDRNKSIEKHAYENDNTNYYTNYNTVRKSVPNNNNLKSKHRTASQERFGEDIDLNNNFNYNKENNPSNIINSNINDSLKNYNTVQNNYNKNSCLYLKTPILNDVKKNLVINSELENKSFKSPNLNEDCSVQPKRGDLTPKSIRSNNTDDENQVNVKPQNLEEKEYIVDTNQSEIEEKASVNIAISNTKKNTTMNDLKFNSIKVNQIKINQNNCESNFKINQIPNVNETLSQNKTVTIKKEQTNDLNNNFNNNNNNKEVNIKNFNDQTTRFFEYRKNNQNQDLESNLSPKSNLAPNKNKTNNNSKNMTRSEINFSQNTTQNNLKTQNSKSKYAQYDTQNLCYELVKEYSHLKIDKDEDFMRRMLFDIFKRQTKEERMEKLIEQNKVTIDENERIRTFNRLIEDANRRIEAQDHMEEMKIRLEMNNVNGKKYKFDEWEEIYQDRFLNYQKYKDQWVEERQREKKELEAVREQELIENCKTVKKPKEEIEQSVQRMYNEAERRQIKMDIKKNKNKITDNIMDIEDFMNDNNLYNKEQRSVTPVLKPTEKNKKKQTNNYQFQSDMSGNENSEDENNKFHSKVKAINERNILSNSPVKKQCPGQKLNYINKNALIKESAYEDCEELSVDISNANNNGSKRILNNNVKRTLNNNNNNNNNNPKHGWNNFYNCKNPKQNLDNKFISNNTEINNKRFEIDPMENKRNIVNGNLNKVNCNVNNIDKAEKTNRMKQFKSKNNNPINAVPDDLNILQENEEDYNKDNNNFNNYNSYALKYEMNIRPLSQSSNINNNPQQQKNYSYINKGDQNSKHMPDHLASKLVDDILNSKFSD